MTIFGVLSFADQGVYDVVHNLGSLVARFVFLPLEDAGYLFFTQILVRGKPAQQQDPVRALSYIMCYTCYLCFYVYATYALQ